MRVRYLFSALMLMAMAAQAQIRLPTLPLSGSPLPNASHLLDSEPPLRLRDVRHLAIGRLIRANRRTIDTDPNGEPVVRGEIVALFVSEGVLARAQSHGFRIDRQQTISGANLRVLVLKPIAKLSTEKALRALRDADPEGLYDYNHIYLGSAGSVNRSITEQTSPPEEPGRPHIRVGLLDTGVDVTHPVFLDSLVHTWGCADAQIPSDHGTAVASLLVAHARAELYAADVYCGSPTGGAVDAIVAAFGWMAQEHVSVINVSLVGPRNTLLERVVSALIARGHVIVAAVGNDGPAAPPLYPAAYANVIGVTAVDAQRHVLIEAERGPQVMFAALGADLKAASLGHGYARVRGTSFAAPTVAALLAAPLPSPDKDAAQAAVAALAKQAIDLGEPGKDLTYGFGLVGAASQTAATSQVGAPSR